VSPRLVSEIGWRRDDESIKGEVVSRDLMDREWASHEGL
jgi:hypothetical protein